MDPKDGILYGSPKSQRRSVAKNDSKGVCRCNERRALGEGRKRRKKKECVGDLTVEEVDVGTQR
jgi:hypothetical protein